MTIFLNDLDGTDGFSLTTQEPGDRSGFHVGGAGDVNGDGLADFLVGAFQADAGNPAPRENDAAGVTYVVFGKLQNNQREFDLQSLDGSEGFKITGSTVNGMSGASVSSAGDFNGDGLDDILIRSFSFGESYVIFGGANHGNASISVDALDGTNGFRFETEEMNRPSFSRGRSLGDINNDGFDDIIVNTGSTGSSNSATVLFGSNKPFDSDFSLTDLDGSDGFTLESADQTDYFGGSVSGAGDINGDGFNDIIVGASRADPNGFYNAGAAFVIFGKESPFEKTFNVALLDGSDGFRIDGASSSNRVGSEVSVAGDINGDGFSDILVTNYDSFKTPRMHVILGQEGKFERSINIGSLDGSDGFSIATGPVQTRPQSISNAGDVNGDGFDDAIVITQNQYRGSVAVIFGKAEEFSPNLDVFSGPFGPMTVLRSSLTMGLLDRSMAQATSTATGSMTSLSACITAITLTVSKSAKASLSLVSTPEHLTKLGPPEAMHSPVMLRGTR